MDQASQVANPLMQNTILPHPSYSAYLFIEKVTIQCQICAKQVSLHVGWQKICTSRIKHRKGVHVGCTGDGKCSFSSHYHCIIMMVTSRIGYYNCMNKTLSSSLALTGRSVDGINSYQAEDQEKNMKFLMFVCVDFCICGPLHSLP